MSTAVSNESVDYQRWRVAQGWEREHWIRNHRALAKYGKNIIWRLLALLGCVEKYRGNDRNRWWKEAFNHYQTLPKNLENAIEVGCGPYTNMRFIREVCRPTHLVLSDPLIRTYVDFNMTFLHEMYKIGACYIDDHSLEELPFGDAHFDLAVMINVLDHVRDARLCMRNLIRIVRPGGYVVIGQDLTDSDDLARQPEGLKVGHPVTLDEKWFEPYLTQNFEQVLYRLMPRDAGWAPEWHYGTLIYIGKKVNDVRSEHDDNRDQ